MPNSAACALVAPRLSAPATTAAPNTHLLMFFIFPPSHTADCFSANPALFQLRLGSCCRLGRRLCEVQTQPFKKVAETAAK
jgi:hypothetical protein